VFLLNRLPLALLRFDIATESPELVPLRVLQNARVAILAQANQTPLITLELLTPSAGA